MPLAAGTLLGPYEIVSALGAGGMGEVYRARDTRLDRIVAIKVLPERFSQRPDLRQRLEREARTISQLSHPNICTLHDIGHQQGIDFLVLEFVPGETLRELIASGKLAMHQVIGIAVQIADGLSRAHESGVIHRDLKPENLMVSPDAVKILDFGLAKIALSEEKTAREKASSSDTSRAKTEAKSTQEDVTTTTLAESQSGGISGTLRYMSPEQAMGKPLDFRSDQFSLGLVLYEAATGRYAFLRRTPEEIFTAILQEEPEPIASLNPQVPPPFCWVVERCMAKDPEKRYFSTRDLLRDLTAIRDRLLDLHAQRESRPSNLPAASTTFVGRANEMAALKELLGKPEVRLVTVTGPGGIGKSRLAVEVARELTESYSGGVYFVPLAAVNEPEQVMQAVSQILGVRESGGVPASNVLKDYLRRSAQPLLLLLDNFEHLVAAAPGLAQLSAAAPNLKLLVTSRAALHISNEHEFPLPPLALPDAKSPLSSATLAKCPAVALFTERAEAVKPGFALTEENASAIAEICSRLDGLPLAIELAAARVKLLTPSAMRTRLASRLQLLTGGAKDLPARQQTLRQAIDWSYDLLSETERRLFRRLAMFVGGCTLDGVESVCDAKQDLGLDVLDGMASMVDKSLVRQIEEDEGEPRFVMLETIREYALMKLKECGEEELTRRAHAAYCLVVAEEGAVDTDSAAAAKWLEQLETERDNFNAALGWLEETGNGAWALRMAVALFRFWEMREHLSEGRDWLNRVLRLEGAKKATNARLRALFAAGVLAGAQSDYDAASRVLGESLEIARELGDRQSMAIALNAEAVNARDSGDVSGSRALFEESLALWRELGDEAAQARGLSNLANVVKLQRDYAKANVLYQECLAIFRGLGDKAGWAWALNHQGDVAREQGDPIEARRLYEQSLAMFRELGDGWGIAGSLEDLGTLAREQGEFEAADRALREGLEIFLKLEHKRGIARLIEAFAGLAAAQREPQRALRLAGAATGLRHSLGAPLSAAEQARLDWSLGPARKGLSTEAARMAWMEGWILPIKAAVDEVLGAAG